VGGNTLRKMIEAELLKAQKKPVTVRTMASRIAREVEKSG